MSRYRREASPPRRRRNSRSRSPNRNPHTRYEDASRDRRRYRSGSEENRSKAKSGRSKRESSIENLVIWRYPGEGGHPLKRREEFRSENPSDEQDFRFAPGYGREFNQRPYGRQFGRGGGGVWDAQRIEPPKKFRQNFRINASNVTVSKATKILLSDRWAQIEEQRIEHAYRADEQPRQRQDYQRGFESYGRPNQSYSRESRPSFGYGESNPNNRGFNRRGFNSFRGGRGGRGGGFPVEERRQTTVYRPGEETEKPPVMNLFDPTNVPKGRSYFDHDDRNRDEMAATGPREFRRGGGGDRGRFDRSRPFYRNQAPRRDYGSDSREYDSERRDGERRHFDRPFQRSSGTDSGQWGHDLYEKLEEEGAINQLGGR